MKAIHFKRKWRIKSFLNPFRLRFTVWRVYRSSFIVTQCDGKYLTWLLLWYSAFEPLIPHHVLTIVVRFDKVFFPFIVCAYFSIFLRCNQKISFLFFLCVDCEHFFYNSSVHDFTFNSIFETFFGFSFIICFWTFSTLCLSGLILFLLILFVMVTIFVSRIFSIVGFCHDFFFHICCFTCICLLLMLLVYASVRLLHVLYLNFFDDVFVFHSRTNHKHNWTQTENHKTCFCRKPKEMWKKSSCMVCTAHITTILTKRWGNSSKQQQRHKEKHKTN